MFLKKEKEIEKKTSKIQKNFFLVKYELLAILLKLCRAQKYFFFKYTNKNTRSFP